MRGSIVSIVLASLVLAGSAHAESSNPTSAAARLGPPNTAPRITGEVCISPGANIPGHGHVVTTQPGGTGTVQGLEVGLEVHHTWVGDLMFTIEHVDTGTTVTVIDRPGFTVTGFGCSGDNIDATLKDGGRDGPVEDACALTAPAIAGVFSPNNPLSAFDGEDFGGTWSLDAIQRVGQDAGTVLTWCLTNSGDVSTTGGETTGGTPTPATSPWGTIVLIALFLGVSGFYLQRRDATA